MWSPSFDLWVRDAASFLPVYSNAIQKKIREPSLNTKVCPKHKRDGHSSASKVRLQLHHYIKWRLTLSADRVRLFSSQKVVVTWPLAWSCHTWPIYITIGIYLGQIEQNACTRSCSCTSFDEELSSVSWFSVSLRARLCSLCRSCSVEYCWDHDLLSDRRRYRVSDGHDSDIWSLHNLVELGLGANSYKSLHLWDTSYNTYLNHQGFQPWSRGIQTRRFIVRTLNNGCVKTLDIIASQFTPTSTSTTWCLLIKRNH